MEILKITIKNARFVKHNDVNVEVYSPTYIQGNGWQCDISDDGNLTCVFKIEHNGMKNQLKLNIKNGEMKLLFKLGYGRPRLLRICKFKDTEINGVLELPDNIRDMRKTRFLKL